MPPTEDSPNQDQDAPFNAASDVTTPPPSDGEPIDESHPTTDTDVQPEEVYEQGVDQASAGATSNRISPGEDEFDMANPVNDQPQ